MSDSRSAGTLAPGIAIRRDLRDALHGGRHWVLSQRPRACKALPICRLLSLTWEFGFPCHSLNRRVSYVVVVNGSGQSSGPVSV